MKILVLSIGTRGDVEPMVAIAEVLMRYGHDVTCAFSGEFRYLVENGPMEFISLGSEYMEVLKTDTAQKAIGGRQSGIGKLISQLRFVKKHLDIEKDTIEKQYQAVQQADPDLVVHNGISFYPFVWMLDHPGQTVLISAVPYGIHYVHDHPYILFKRNFGPFLNRFTYKLAEDGAANSTRRAMKHLNYDRKITKGEIIRAARKVKTVYAISNSLFERPDYWEDWTVVSGFFERRQSIEFTPDEELVSFLTRHQKIVFISMGSMVNPNPEFLTTMFLDILQKLNIPAIFATNAGAFITPDSFDNHLFYFTKTIPYHWIFPQVYAVIHHGGSGTVHTALKYGCASMAIPHFIDQFLWNKIIWKKGAGPKGIKISKITRQNLEPLILDLYQNPEYRQNAESISAQMAQESSEEKLHEFITNAHFPEPRASGKQSGNYPRA